MKDTIEIRWHGRGGQGAKTAALLLADVAFKTGKYVQGFPEYGPERMGAPITAYNRISSKPITVHSNIYDPDYVVVVDESLLDSIDVTKGLNPEGAVIVNSTQEDNIIKSVAFTGGCNGNLKGISALVAGMSVDDAISKLKGIQCGFKSTSCPDQLARALEQYKAETAKS